ncbi:hypothetical protein DB347_17880 [Opitutaceae bacterium EW11]|nr:hypothetical protein DB347_17880 [Opitutaceae bacterium EW11]
MIFQLCIIAGVTAFATYNIATFGSRKLTTKLEGKTLIQSDRLGGDRATLDAVWWPRESQRTIALLAATNPTLVCGIDAVLRDGRRMTEVIVSEGLGFSCSTCSSLYSLEQQARAERRGLWRDDPTARFTYAARMQRESTQGS